MPQLNTIDDSYPLTVLQVVLMGRYPLLGLMRRHARPTASAPFTRWSRSGSPSSPSPLRDLSGGQRQRALMARALTPLTLHPGHGRAD